MNNESIPNHNTKPGIPSYRGHFQCKHGTQNVHFEMCIYKCIAILFLEVHNERARDWEGILSI